MLRVVCQAKYETTTNNKEDCRWLTEREGTVRCQSRCRNTNASTQTALCALQRNIFHTTSYAAMFFLCSLSTHFITAIAGSSCVYVHQYLCERAKMRGSSHKRNAGHSRFSVLGSRWRCYLIFNQQLPKTEIRLLPATCSSPTHFVRNCEKVWSQQKDA